VLRRCVELILVFFTSTDLSSNLNDTKSGCYIGNVVNHVFFADYISSMIQSENCLITVL